MIAEYNEYKKILGLEEGFTYIQLTRRFTELKKGADEEQLDRLADAYDFMRKNFKKLKNINTSNTMTEGSGDGGGGDFFPKIHPDIRKPTNVAVEYPIFKDKEGNILDILMVPDFKLGMLPTIPKGEFKRGQKVIFFQDGELHSALVNLDR